MILHNFCVYFQNFFVITERNSVSIKWLLLRPYSASFQQPHLHCVSVRLSILDISHSWSHNTRLYVPGFFPFNTVFLRFTHICGIQQGFISFYGFLWYTVCTKICLSTHPLKNTWVVSTAFGHICEQSCYKKSVHMYLFICFRSTWLNTYEWDTEYFLALRFLLWENCARQAQQELGWLRDLHWPANADS